MTKVLIYKHWKTGLTGRKLGRELGIRAVGSLRTITNPVLLIRWGNSEPARCQMEFNKASAIQLAANKELALQKLGEELNVPRFTSSFPAIGRKRYHQGGRDIKICLSQADVADVDYLLEIIPSEREFRVHVVDGQVICTQVKEPDEEQQFCSRIAVRMECSEHGYPYSEAALPVNESLPHVVFRNHGRGWRFRRLMNRPDSMLSSTAIAAVSILGLDFGAVDILKSTSGSYYVLEVNTAPALMLGTLERYVRAFKEIIERS